MIKVKMFFGTGVREDQINNWFENNPNIKIIKIKQSSTNSDTYITIFYKEKSEPTELFRRK